MFGKNKMKKILFAFFIFVSSIFAQDIFYQKNHITYYNEKPIIINVKNREYNLYNGIASTNGKYIAGIIIDDMMSEYIVSLNKSGVPETLAPEWNRLILFSISDSTILYDSKIKGIPRIYFIDNDLVTEYWGYHIETINIKSKDFMDFTANDLNEMFSIYNNNIFKLKEEDFHTNIYKFDYCLRNFIFYSNAINKMNTIIYIDNNYMIVKDDAESKTVLSLISINRALKKYSFERIDYLLTTEDGLFFVGSDNSEDTYLYHYNNAENEVVELLPLHTEETKGFLISQVNDVILDGKNVYFSVSSLSPENENIISYNLNTKLFKQVTYSGYITPPIGLVKNFLIN
jgi:hypothetical protein